MKTSAIVASVLSLAGASSAFSVQINATTKGIDNPNGQNKILTANGYGLNTYPGLAVTALQLVQTQPAGNPSPANIECRAYKDSAGNLPGSEAFSGSKTALIGTNTKAIGSILCYAIGALTQA